LSDQQFNYDGNGNVHALTDSVGIGSNSATLSYQVLAYPAFNQDIDRICRIGYGSAGLGGTDCNVGYDGAGNITMEPAQQRDALLRLFGQRPHPHDQRYAWERRPYLLRCPGQTYKNCRSPSAVVALGDQRAEMKIVTRIAIAATLRARRATRWPG
jgi:hypothetical protein